TNGLEFDEWTWKKLFNGGTFKSNVKVMISNHQHQHFLHPTDSNVFVLLIVQQNLGETFV
ncbi:hypothetical protein, partial [Gelidibacter salicanalis]|uniref:hypothetical protein n=1 Tax=Gelidibacter salicanalis TaxID=291193 RepID=UPI001F400AF8